LPVSEFIWIFNVELPLTELIPIITIIISSMPDIPETVIVAAPVKAVPPEFSKE
jgi:hypothetical protein